MRAAFFSLIGLVFAASAAWAGTFPVPGDDPVATVSIPGEWEPKAYDGGVEATSPDGGVYIAVEMVKADDVKAATGEGIEWFAKQGVEIDADSMKTEEGKMGGMPAFDITFSGKDKDGPTSISMTLVGTNASNKFLMVYFWGSPKAAADNMEELNKIANTLQPTK